MEEAIKNFPKQFLWEPHIVGNERLEVGGWKRFIVCGMGGSALAGDLLRISVWRDYGLPKEIDAKNTFVIACSYSGNTEETIDAFLEARKRGLPVAAVSTGGKLLELAIQHHISYIQLPNTGIQPRMAAGYSIKALLKLMGEEEKLMGIKKLAETLDVEAAGQKGKELSQSLKGKLPIIYSSSRNFPIAYNWKIKFNETGKIPAFANCFPELNHNEMTGFDWKRDTNLRMRANDANGGSFFFILLEDPDDDPRIIKRMQITKKLFEDRGLTAYSIGLYGDSIWHKIFQNLLIADWAAFYLAKFYGVDPEQVPMVEELKKLMQLNVVS